MFEDEENTVEDNEEVIRRAADIKIKDVGWFNANYGPDFTYVKDLFTKKTFQTDKEYRKIINENVFNFVACHASIAVTETMKSYDQWLNTAINFENSLKNMHLITNLKQLFDNFEGKAWPNGFEDYVRDIQNLNTLNKVKSNSSYKAVSDEGEKSSVAFGCRLREIYDKVRKEINKSLLIYWIDKLPSGTSPLSLMLSILHKAYWDDCNRRAKETIRKAKSRNPKTKTSSATSAVASADIDDIEDGDDVEEIDGDEDNQSVADIEAIIIRTNEVYKTFTIGKWYPSCWLTFLLYSKPGGRNGMQTVQCQRFEI